jgi:hypothetical protein
VANAREPIDVEYLLTWLAPRTDRAVHQAGDRPPLERLRFMCDRWLSAEDRESASADGQLQPQHRTRTGRTSRASRTMA